MAKRLSKRYIAGERIEDALAAVRSAGARGHLGSIEYVGESIRSIDVANAETAVFVDLAQAIGTAGAPSTVSFDLSHVGSVIDPPARSSMSNPIAEAISGNFLIS